MKLHVLLAGHLWRQRGDSADPGVGHGGARCAAPHNAPMEDQHHYLYIGLALVALLLIMLAKRRRSAMACV